MSKPILAGIFVTLLSLTNVFAQNPTKYSIEDLEQILLKSSVSLQVQDKAIEKSEVEIKTAWNFEKTGIYYEWDETNLDANNNVYKVWGVQQDFLFPSVYAAAKTSKQKQYELEQLRKDKITQDLLYILHQTYQNYLLTEERDKNYQALDSLYARFESAANRKFELGESPYLEKVTAISKRKQLRILLENNSNQRNRLLRQIQELLNLEETFELEAKDLEILALLDSESSDRLQESPMLQLQATDTELKESVLKLERRQLLPDWNIGYFQSHSSAQSKGLYGYQIGLKIPLLFGSQKNSIKAARLEVEQSQLQQKELKTHLKSRWDQKILSLKEAQFALEYYTNEGKQLAEQLLHMATRSYQEGEIDFLQYVQTIEHAQSIQVEHLEHIYAHNNTLLELIYHQY